MNRLLGGFSGSSCVRGLFAISGAWIFEFFFVIFSYARSMIFADLVMNRPLGFSGFFLCSGSFRDIRCLDF